MGRRLICVCWVFVFSLVGFVADAHAVPWLPLGPYGGDARSIAADPHDPNHLYLGTENGWIYQSADGGVTWHRLAQIAKRNDMVIDHILVDPSNPQRMIAGAWVIDHPDGGVFISDDGGHSWYDQAQMRGQSIRSMARGIADPREIVAGTLKGVFRSDDDGIHWSQISPPASMEIHEVESVAIDPRDGNVIYAGTWHLPWKTTDGGAHWVNIKNGIIDDSDVFSIVVDPANPNIVYASACSGIYKSEDAGGAFKGGVSLNRGQGIPTAARRTRKLAQDPNQPGIVLAGTTEGLYRTVDAGGRWERLTSANVIVNDVYIDPANSNHILLATDRGGVLRSEDGGVSFEPSNEGFSLRQVVSYAADPHQPGTLYIGVVNDKASGGVFQSVDGGVRWDQMSDGLGGRDVFSLMMLDDGTLFAGTTHGIFRLQDGTWRESDAVVAAAAKPAATAKKPVSKTSRTTSSSHKSHSRTLVAKKKPVPAAAASTLPKRLDEVIYAMAEQPGTLYAATTLGLVHSVDNGDTWSSVSSLVMPEVRFLDVRNKLVFAGSLRRLELSVDGGSRWDPVALPPSLTQVSALCLDDMGNLWVGGREGVYYSTDYGESWKGLRNLFMTQVDSLHFNAAARRVLVTSTGSPFVFAVTLPDYKVTYWDAGWDLRFARIVGDHMIGATLFDGMVVQPRMVDSKFR